MTKILIVVDMQKDFVTGVLGTPEAQAIVPAVAARIDQAHRDAEPVYFTFDTHLPDYLQTQEGTYLPVEHCIRDTEGHGLADGIAQACTGADILVEKPTFGSERLAELLANYALREGEPSGRGLQIELSGVCTDICVVSNALLIKARLPEAKLIVQAHLCAGVTPEKHECALEVLRSCQVEVLP